jgi:hypothetical protein
MLTMRSWFMVFLNLLLGGDKGSLRRGGNVRIKVPICASKSRNAVELRAVARASVHMRSRTNWLTLRSSRQAGIAPEPFQRWYANEKRGEGLYL